MAKELDSQAFQQEIVDQKQTALIDFWAPWCGPCRMLAPIVENLSKKYSGKVFVAKMNIDNSSDVASKFNITAIPTLVFFKDGEVVHKTLGVMPEPELDQLIQKHLL